MISFNTYAYKEKNVAVKIQPQKDIDKIR